MTREQKMQAVVDAARVTAREIGATGTLLAALAALDADAEAQTGETVEVRGHVIWNDTVRRAVLTREDSGYDERFWRIIANVVVNVHPPTIPTIAVTLPLDRERGE